MKNRGIAERALWKAFILMLGLGAVAHAGLGYLPLVGPPPLRIVAAKKPVTVLVPLDLSADTNMAAELATNESDKFLALNAAALTGQTNSTDDMLPIALGAGNVSDDPFAPAVFALAPPELLNITPQMLTAFFHPIARGTNDGPGVAGPVPVMFMPPAIKSSPSSHAEYIVK